MHFLGGGGTFLTNGWGPGYQSLSYTATFVLLPIPPVVTKVESPLSPYLDGLRLDPQRQIVIPNQL